MRTVWIAALAGGPFEYRGLPLHDAHARLRLTGAARLRLTGAEFDEVGAEIVRALDHYKVPEPEKKALVDAYMLSKPDVVAQA